METADRQWTYGELADQSTIDGWAPGRRYQVLTQVSGDGCTHLAPTCPKLTPQVWSSNVVVVGERGGITSGTLRLCSCAAPLLALEYAHRLLLDPAAGPGSTPISSFEQAAFRGRGHATSQDGATVADRWYRSITARYLGGIDRPCGEDLAVFVADSAMIGEHPKPGLAGLVLTAAEPATALYGTAAGAGSTVVAGVTTAKVATQSNSVHHLLLAGSWTTTAVDRLVATVAGLARTDPRLATRASAPAFLAAAVELAAVPPRNVTALSSRPLVTSAAPPDLGAFKVCPTRRGRVRRGARRGW